MSGANGAMWARLAVRALVSCSAGVMAAGFFDWRAGALVAGLTAFSFVLLTVVPAPRTSWLPALYGRHRLLCELRRHGYRVVPDDASRYLVVGPGGGYLLDTRVWQHAVSRGPRDWRIGERPASRVVDRMVEYATRLEQAAGPPDRATALRIVPVIMVVGRLPEPVMRAGRGIIARPRDAVRYLLQQPEILEPVEIEEFADGVERLRAR